MRIFYVRFNHETLYICQVKNSINNHDHTENSLLIMGKNMKEVTHKLTRLTNAGPYNRIFWETE